MGPRENRERFIKQIETSEEFKVLEKVANQDGATPGDAVQRVIELTMAAHAADTGTRNKAAADVDYNVALVLVELAQRLEPTKHEGLVDFIYKLQKQTATDPSTGQVLKTQGRTLWTDLPSLSSAELEGWYEYGGEPRTSELTLRCIIGA